MTDTYAPPSVNPADEGSLTGAMRLMARKMLVGLETMLPARVVAYDRTRNRAAVQPLISMVTTTGAAVSRAQIPSVPVLQLGGGGFVLSFPVLPDDLGWIIAADRDISLFLQSLEDGAPNTARVHSFQDALFVPDALRQWTLDPADAQRAVWQSTDGATRIAIGADGVFVTAPAVEVDSPLVTMTGDLTVAGRVTGQGGVTGSGGIVLETHRHLGVTTGSGTSGGPTP